MTGTTGQEKGNEKKAKLTAQDEEILNLNVKLKDLKDLYDNAIHENKELVKTKNALKAEILEKQDTIDSLTKEMASIEFGGEQKILELETENAVQAARLHEKEATIVSFQKILLKAFSNE